MRLHLLCSAGFARARAAAHGAHAAADAPGAAAAARASLRFGVCCLLAEHDRRQIDIYR